MRVFRETLTVIAALVVLGLLAAMIAPGFMDWNQYRDRVATAISQKIGQPVSIAGDLRLSFLPVPEIDAEGVTLGPEDRPLLTAERFTASLSLAALAGGAIKITQARIDRARIALDTLLDPAAPRMPAGSGIERLDIKSVTLLAGGDVLTSGVDIVLEAPDLSGPFRLDVLNPAKSRDFRAQIGKVTDGRARMKGLVEDKKLGLRASLDGVISLPDASGRPIFDGQALFNGNPVFGGSEGPQLPFDGSARLIVVAGQAIADPLNIALGTGENALQFAGQTHVDLAGSRPRLVAELSAKRLDAAALLPASEPGHQPQAPLAELMTKLQALDLPFDLDLALQIGAIQLPGGLITEANLSASGTSQGLRARAMSAKLPGATSLEYKRDPRAGSALFDGRLALETRDPTAFLLWLRGGEASNGLPTSIRLETGITGSGTHFELPGIFIASEAGALSGSGRLDLSRPALPARLTLGLKANRFDARVLAALDPLRAKGGLELATTLEIASLVLDGTVVGGLNVALERDGTRAHLRQFRLRGPQGEELSLSGTASSEVTQLTAKLDAERLEALARLTAALLPGPLSEALIPRAPLLSPALAVANIRIEPRAGDAIWDIVLDGRLGGSSVKLRSHSTVTGQDLVLAVEGEITNEDGARLLRQLSGAPLGAAPSLPGRLKLKADGNPRRVVQGTLTGTVAGIDIEADGALTPFRQGRQLEGRLRIESGDISVLHRALGGGAPQIASGTRARIEGRYFTEGAKLTLTAMRSEFGPNRVAGEISFDFARGGQVAGQLKMDDLALPTLLGPLSGLTPAALAEARFSAALHAEPTRPLASGDLWIEAERIAIAGGLVLIQPQFVLRFAPGLVAIEGFEARQPVTGAADARYQATITLGRKGRSIEAAGRIAAQDVPLPGVAGRFTAEVPFSASGETGEALLQSLGGAGQITIRGLVLPEADIEGLMRVATRPLDALVPIEENRIGALVDGELKRATLALPALAFPLTLINGQMRLGGTTLDARLSPSPRVRVQPQMLLDLPRRFLDARIGMRLTEAPPGWRGAPPEIALGWTGRLGEGAPASGIRRQVSVSPLVNGLLAIQLQRDLERAEAFELDVRERASLLRRQRADQFMQRRRLEVEAFEKAEADRKAKEELEALLRRQAEEARANAASGAAPATNTPASSTPRPVIVPPPTPGRPLDLRPLGEVQNPAAPAQQ